MLIVNKIKTKRKCMKIDKKIKKVIHNHEVPSSILGLATRNREVNERE